MIRKWWWLAAVALLVTACGSDSKTSSSSSSTAGSSSSSSSSSSTSSSSSSSSGGPTTTVKVYFIRAEKVGAARRTVPDSGAPAKGAMEALLQGTNDADKAAHLSSEIPAGTKLNGVTIANGVATVDLSRSFESGGGSVSMQGRVAQVVYTLTQFPTVQRVAFELDGQAVTSIGGEGVMVDPPQSRADWESFTPAILVESPLPGDSITSPVHITGTANTFEATFQIRLTDSAGNKLYDHSAMATSGTGTRGTFDETVSFTTNNHGAGTLTVLELSAKDGSEINVVSYPVNL